MTVSDWAQLGMYVLMVLAATPEFRRFFRDMEDGNVERMEAEERRWFARLSRLS